MPSAGGLMRTLARKASAAPSTCEGREHLGGTDAQHRRAYSGSSPAHTTRPGVAMLAHQHHERRHWRGRRRIGHHRAGLAHPGQHQRVFVHAGRHHHVSRGRAARGGRHVLEHHERAAGGGHVLQQGPQRRAVTVNSTLPSIGGGACCNRISKRSSSTAARTPEDQHHQEVAQELREDHEAGHHRWCQQLSPPNPVVVIDSVAHSRLCR